MILLLSVLGLGVWSYFQGRSHPNNLSMVSYPAIHLVTIFCDRYLGGVADAPKKHLLFHRYLALCVLFFLGFGIPYATLSFAKAVPRHYRHTQTPPDERFRADIEFIKDKSAPDENIVILCHQNIDYWLESGRRYAMPTPTDIEMLTLEQLKAVDDFLAAHDDIQVFILDKHKANYYKMFPSLEEYKSVAKSIVTKGKSGYIRLYHKKKPKAPKAEKKAPLENPPSP